MNEQPVADLPGSLALAWGVPLPPRRGPKRELSIERILEAAVEVADAEGIDAVTMQRIAGEFGFTTMALYRYISTKDELHELMVNSVLLESVERRQYPDADREIRSISESLLSLYSEHAWMLDIIIPERVQLMPGYLAWANRILDVLSDIRVPENRAPGLCALLLSTIHSAAQITKKTTNPLPPNVMREAMKHASSSGGGRADLKRVAPVVAGGTPIGQSLDSADIADFFVHALRSYELRDGHQHSPSGEKLG